MRSSDGPTGLLGLPPELLFEILAYSSSSSLPLVNKYLLHTFKYASPLCRALFILGQLGRVHSDKIMLLVPTVILEGALSYPICTTAVLDALERMSPFAGMSPVLLKSIRVTPGRWLFRNLQTQPRPARRRKLGTGPRSAPGTSALSSPSPSLLSTHSGTNPLGFLQAVASRYTLWFTARGSAFALSMCVRAGPAQYPLLQFLLQSGADPAAQSCLPLQIAATIGDMHALKVMIEPGEDVQEGKFKGGKRRRIEDRVQPTPKVLSAAMKAKHIQVAKWLVNEKGVVPDMATMQMLQHV